MKAEQIASLLFLTLYHLFESQNPLLLSDTYVKGQEVVQSMFPVAQVRRKGRQTHTEAFG